MTFVCLLAIEAAVQMEIVILTTRGQAAPPKPAYILHTHVRVRETKVA